MTEIELKTSYFNGANCSGSSGQSNRILTLDNTKTTSSSGFLVSVSGLTLSVGSEYTVSHQSSGTSITFLNNLFNDQLIVVNYTQQVTAATIGSSLTSGDKVTYSNLMSKPRENVLSVINTNVDDPISGSGESRKWIYSRIPDVKSADFKGYPFIVIYPTEFDVEEGGSLHGKSKFVSWQLEIEIFTSDRGYGSADGQGMTHLDLISNGIMTTLLDMTVRNSLGSNIMKFSRPRPTSVTIEEIGDELVYRRSIISTFKNRMQISA